VRQQWTEKTSHSMTSSGSDFERYTIWGLDVRVVTPCRCGSPLIRVHPYSVKSSIPIWKCSWCARRKGKLTETEIKLLERWVHQFAWTLESLVFHEDRKVYASCQLPTLREATSGLRRTNRLVPAVSADDAANSGIRVPGESERTVARRRGNVAVKAGIEPD
jgi:hypothetical protein